MNIFNKTIIFFTKIINTLFNSKKISNIIAKSKELALPGFDNIPLYNVALFFYKGIKKGSITERAAALSFNFFLALFPTIIFFFSIIPYIPINNFQDSLLKLIYNFIPNKIYDAVQTTIFDIITRPRSGVLSIGFILALYFSTNTINSLIQAFNHTYHSIETRSFLKQRMVSFILVIIISVLVIIAIALMTITPSILNYLKNINILNDMVAYYAILFGRWIVIVALLFFAFSFLFYFAPSKKGEFKLISAGSTLATVLFIFTLIGFNFYINNFARYNYLYGSIGTLIIFMLWIYFNSIIILLGFELNASIAEARKFKNNN